MAMPWEEEGDARDVFRDILNDFHQDHHQQAVPSYDPRQLQWEEGKKQLRSLMIQAYGDRILQEKDDSFFLRDLRTFLNERINEVEGLRHLSATDRQQAVQEIMDNLVGYGPLQVFLDDEGISEIEVARFDRIYVEQSGKMVLQPDAKFPNEEALVTLIESIGDPLGKRFDAMHPQLDAWLSDGSRIHATRREISPDGATLSIRKFPKKRMMVQDFLKVGSLTSGMVHILDLSIKAHLNVIISGGTGTGKTMLLNMLSSMVPSYLSIITDEDVLELNLQQSNVRRFKTREANENGEGGVSMRHLIKGNLRQRPDVIICGESRGGEIVDIFRAGTSGHQMLTTAHADDTRELVDSALPIMMGMSDMSFSEATQKRMIASGVKVIAQLKRFSDGSRKVVAITYVVGYGKEAGRLCGVERPEADILYLKDIYRYDEQAHVFRFMGLPQPWRQKINDEGLLIDESLLLADANHEEGSR